MSWYSGLINVLLPPRCIKCGKILSERNGLCPECFNKINFISEPFCYHCGRPFHNEIQTNAANRYFCGACLKHKHPLFELQRSAFIYDSNSKELILDFKFNDQTSSAEPLTKMLWSAGRDIWQENPDLLIPVPIHKLRLLKRRYNQAALLAKYLSQLTNIPVDYCSLIRHENTVPQVSLSRNDRRKNLKKAFSLKYPERICGKNIVLIDDVETTGSTLSECAKVLKRHKAGKIYALTVARTET